MPNGCLEIRVNNKDKIIAETESSLTVNVFGYLAEAPKTQKRKRKNNTSNRRRRQRPDDVEEVIQFIEKCVQNESSAKVSVKKLGEKIQKKFKRSFRKFGHGKLGRYIETSEKFRLVDNNVNVALR